MRSLFFFATLGLLAACSGSVVDGDPAAPTGEVRITDVSLDASGSDLLVRVRVENGTANAVYAISSPRRSRYDADTRTLSLSLSEQTRQPTGSSADCHYVAPSQARIGALTATTLELHLPRVQKQLAASSAPKVIDVPIYQSRRVDVDLGWGAVPLVPDQAVVSKCALEMSENVAAKQRGVATGAWTAP